MVYYECLSCNKKFTKKCNYEAHMNRKKQCGLKINNLPQELKNYHLITTNSAEKNITNETGTTISTVEIKPKRERRVYICQYCEKEYSRQDAVTRHQEVCTDKKEHDNEIEILLQQLNDARNEIQKKNQTIDTLSKEVKTLKTEKVIQPSIVQNVQNIQNNNYFIGVMPFGKEDLSYIPDDIYKKILHRCYNSVPILMEHIHFNEKHPENHNIFMSNTRGDEVIVFDGIYWNHEDKDETLEQLYSDCSNILETKFDELMNQMDESEQVRCKRFIDDIGNQQIIKKIKRNLILKLYNKRHVVIKTKKILETTKTREIEYK